MTFRLATWNINSVRLRLPLIKQFVERFDPDILCLQETKCADESFPIDAFAQMGLPNAQINGQKAYHGVATLAKANKTINVTEKRDFNDTGHARHLAVSIGQEGATTEPLLLHNFYVPAGGDEPDIETNQKFREKLTYLNEMEAWTKKMRNKSSRRMILVGDLNIAPHENDVWSHKQLLKVVSHTPIEVEHLTRVQNAHSWVDWVREKIPVEEKLFTWWSYRARDWEASNRGRRLDHIWATPALNGAASNLSVIKEARGWEKPSDHVPIICDIKL